MDGQMQIERVQTFRKAQNRSPILLPPNGWDAVIARQFAHA